MMMLHVDVGFKATGSVSMTVSAAAAMERAMTSAMSSHVALLGRATITEVRLERSCPSSALKRLTAAGGRQRGLVRPQASRSSGDEGKEGIFEATVDSTGSTGGKGSSKPMKQNSAPLSEEERERRRQMQEELTSAQSVFDFLAPRPLRRVYFGFGAASCALALFITAAKIAQSPALELAQGGYFNLGVNSLGLVAFAALFWWDGQNRERGMRQQQAEREAQIKRGDREVITTAAGSRISRLKPVDDDWIVRRLDRWGQQDLLPQIGPKKAIILQGLVQQQQPRFIIEVGSLMGYSAIRMAQAMPTSCSLVSFESDFKWMLVAKRFVWQAKMSSVIDIRWGDARQELLKLPSSTPIDLLFLDGNPKEYLDYLLAAESKLAPGAMVVADNAGVFEKSLTPYLNYVWDSPKYSSKQIYCTFEYRDDVEDKIEVSIYNG